MGGSCKVLDLLANFLTLAGGLRGGTGPLLAPSMDPSADQGLDVDPSTVLARLRKATGESLLLIFTYELSQRLTFLTFEHFERYAC